MMIIVRRFLVAVKCYAMPIEEEEKSVVDGEPWSPESSGGLLPRGSGVRMVKAEAYTYSGQ